MIINTAFCSLMVNNLNLLIVIINKSLVIGVHISVDRFHDAPEFIIDLVHKIESVQIPNIIFCLDGLPGPTITVGYCLLISRP